MASPAEAEQRSNFLAATWRGLSKPVFIPALLIIFAALTFTTWYGAAYGDDAETAFTNLRDGIGETVGWWYILLVTSFLIFAFWGALSKAGNIRLGRDDEKPEFSLFSWFAMLFSAGMGIGLVFWGVAEPLNHMTSPPEIADVEAGTAEAGRAAIGQALFHWGLHAWGIYVVVGLGLAYMSFRRGRPLSMRWLLEPIFGRRLIESWLGHIIDVFAIVGTIFGVATSLGQGALQIQAGLAYLGWFDPSDTLLLVLVMLITAVGTVSVITGLHKGLRLLSNANMMLAAVLAICVLLIGPTIFLFQSVVQNTGEYAQVIPQLMFVTGAGAKDDWTVSWTLFDQGWFLSWAPFVGMFIARVSRGRTIREFIFGVMLAPTGIAILWFTIFGSTGIHYQLTNGTMIGEDGIIDTNTSLFLLFENLPAGGGVVVAMSVIAILVITLFFVTSSDSCSLVVDVLAHGGRTETPWLTRLFWAVILGVAGALLLLAGGEAALTVLQVSSIAGAAPLSVIYALAMLALVRMFRYEIAIMPRYVHIRSQATLSALVSTARERADNEEEFQHNLRRLLKFRSDWECSRSGVENTSVAVEGREVNTADKSVVPTTNDTDTTVLAVQDVPHHATKVNTENGSIEWDKDCAFQDPIAGEVFDTSEFTISAVGAERETEKILRKYISDDCY
ncbi:BCCT family transporter [Actinopolyspora mortivallis]|uniref:BCCT family transporter n=1 Tax=Actinopolyspora mortivallis TaxID=33906 RepID=UPI0003A87CDD|nr:BCCT family transporter [Actinopolyspora mortivallis]